MVSNSFGIKSKPYELEVYRAQVALPTVQIAYPSRSTIEYGQSVDLQGTAKGSACTDAPRNRLILNWDVVVLDGNGTYRLLEQDGEHIMKAGLTFPFSVA